MNGSSRRWPDGFRNDGSLWRLVEIACLTYSYTNEIYARNISPFARLVQLLSAHVLIAKPWEDEDLE